MHRHQSEPEITEPHLKWARCLIDRHFEVHKQLDIRINKDLDRFSRKIDLCSLKMKNIKKKINEMNLSIKKLEKKSREKLTQR